MCLVTKLNLSPSMQDQNRTYNYRIQNKFENAAFAYMFKIEPLMFKEDKFLTTSLNITTLVLSNVTAKISKVCETYGFIDYKLDNLTLQKTLTKDGAITLPENNGKIFFHENELSGNLDSYKSGDIVNFDIIHNKKSNKIICNRISKQLLKPVKRQNLQESIICKKLAHFQFDNKIQNNLPKILSNQTGKISVLETNYAFINFPYKNQTNIYFSNIDMFGNILSNLKIQDTVNFDLHLNMETKVYVAKNVEIVQNPVSNLSLNKEITDITYNTSKTSAISKRTLVQFNSNRRRSIEKIEFNSEKLFMNTVR